jgi:hypothetical protein
LREAAHENNVCGGCLFRATPLLSSCNVPDKYFYHQTLAIN